MVISISPISNDVEEKGGAEEYMETHAFEIRGRQEGAAQKLRNAVLVRAERGICANKEMVGDIG